MNYLDPGYWFFLMLNVAPIVAVLWGGYQLLMLLDGWVEAKRRRWHNDASLTRPDSNGMFPISSEALIHIADPERIIALAEKLIEARKVHPNVPLTLTYSPTNRSDKALDIDVTPGFGVTGGGTFKLFDQPAKDKRFTALAEEVSIDLGQEVSQDAELHDAD